VDEHDRTRRVLWPDNSVFQRPAGQIDAWHVRSSE
jgi:hypothetical protein